MSQPMTNGNPAGIGIFDSGIGGLTVFRELRSRLPREHLVYLGDTARVPYGTKSAETVTRYSMQNVEFLLQKDIKLIVVACNTASALALPTLQQQYPLPILGVVAAGVRKALGLTPRKRIGIIGTEATIQSGSYQRRLQDQDPSVTVLSQACPLFVPLVEEGWLDTEVTGLVAKNYLAPLQNKVDSLILGCTHYPLLKAVIQKIMGPQVTLVDSAEQIAQEVQSLLTQRGWLNQGPEPGRDEFFVTDSPERLLRVGRLFVDHLSEVKTVQVG